MTFRETFYQVKELMESRLHDFGLESADADTMGWTTMLSIEQDTNLTIDVPLNLIYDDNFNISGVLETSTFSRLANKTIKLKVGNTVVDTTTTNNYGEYSFTQTPVSMGNHTFQVIFEGTNIHGASTSPTVTRDILRETTILNASVSLNVISGTLISDDFEQTNEVLSNATIKIYENNSLIGSTTTDNLGRFSYTYDGASIDTTLTLEYEQTENYTGSTKDVHVVIYDSISLSTDKSILSYSDGESATLSAQLLNNGSNVSVSDVSIDFKKIIGEYGNKNDIGSGLNIDIGDSWVMKSNGQVKIGDNSNYMEIKFSKGQINIVENGSSNSFTFNVKGSMEGGIISFDNGVLSDSNGEIIDLANDYSSIDYTILDTISFSQPFLTMGIAHLNIYEIIGSATTNANGQCSVSYHSKHSGSLSIKCSCNNIESSAITIYDWWVYDTGATDKSNNFGTPTTILSNSNATLTHDSTNGYYVATKITNAGLVNIPITGITGLSDIVLEFDAYIPSSQSMPVNVGAGVGTVAFSQLGGANNPATDNIYANGDNVSSYTGHYDGEWTTHKLIISNGTVTWTIKRQNNTQITNRNWNISISSNTPIGLSIGYQTNASAYFKNIKVYPL